MKIPDARFERAAVLLTLGLVAVNLATTGRWAAVPGALRGWRAPYLALALVVAAVLAFRPARPSWRPPRWLAPSVAVAGASALAACLLLTWFPPSAWHLLPFLDDWPPRFACTVDGVRLLLGGSFVGWQWNLLGGYSTATDITQSLTLLGAVPMTLFGNAVGFHLLHLGLFCAVPLLVWRDIRREVSREAGWFALGFVALAMAAEGWTLIRSGDTNSLAGLFAVMLVVLASRRARARRPYGFTLLVAALAVAAYAHVGFFGYACGLLVVEAAYYRDAWHLARATAAGALACAASLPLTYELVRYPGLFISNNVLYTPPEHVDWFGVIRQVGYNTEVLFLPSRWLNDAAGLTSLALPIVAWSAWRREGRLGFYAWAALYAFVLLRFNVLEAGYVFKRPEHLLAVFTPVTLAGFLAAKPRDHGLAAALAVVVVLLFQVPWIDLPHEKSVAEYAPDLVGRLRQLDGNLVVVENNPHRDVVAARGQKSEPSRFGTHFEAMLPEATGKRLYAGYWDGWQWTKARGDMLAGGAWKGKMLAPDDEAAFAGEMRRWGARHAVVWSATAQRVFGGWSRFALRWQRGPWQQYELVDAQPDVRSVVTRTGGGSLVEASMRGGTVRLDGVRTGDPVVVRTRFHPAWSVSWKGGALEPLDIDGQLGFRAPGDGSYDVTLSYPARRGLLLATLLLFAVLAFAERLLSARRGIFRRDAAATLPA